MFYEPTSPDHWLHKTQTGCYTRHNQTHLNGLYEGKNTTNELRSTIKTITDTSNEARAMLIALEKVANGGGIIMMNTMNRYGLRIGIALAIAAIIGHFSGITNPIGLC